MALGMRTVCLSVLVLDHNHLGDIGIAALSPGLRRCASLKQLSLAFCGIGASGAASLRDCLAQDEPSALSSTLLDTRPKLIYLNLQGNPLGSDGLVEMAWTIERMLTLKSVTLADTAITDQDLHAIKALVDALATNSSVESVDIDRNFIGKEGLSLFLPMLSVSKHMRGLRFCHRVPRSLVASITEVLKENCKAAKKSGGAKKKKKKS